MNAMNLSDIVIIASIITGILSIPFLTIGLKDFSFVGTRVLNLSESETNFLPAKFSKYLSPEKFENVYETAFGRFKITISSDETIQELSRPGVVVSVVENTDETVWKIITQEYELKITRTSGKVIQECTTPDGQLVKVKEMGEINESFRGVNLDKVSKMCEEAEKSLQKEVERMEEIKSETELPDIGEEQRVLINEFVSDPNEGESEWIELYNPNDYEIELNEWTIEDNSASPEILSGKISSKGYLLLNKSSGDFGFSLDNTKDIILLKKNGKIVDKVTYGNYNDGNILDNAPAPPKGNSTGRYPNGVDTDVDVNDFKIFVTSTPGTSNK